MRVRLRVHLYLHQIAMLYLWDVLCQLQRMGIKLIPCVCVKLQTKTHSVNGPLVIRTHNMSFLGNYNLCICRAFPHVHQALPHTSFSK